MYVVIGKQSVFRVSWFPTPLHYRRRHPTIGGELIVKTRGGEGMADSCMLDNKQFSPYRKLVPASFGTYVTSAIPEPLPKNVTEEASSVGLQLVPVSLLATVTLRPRVVVAAAALSARNSSAVTLNPPPKRLLLHRSLA